MSQNHVAKTNNLKSLINQVMIESRMILKSINDIKNRTIDKRSFTDLKYLLKLSNESNNLLIATKCVVSLAKTIKTKTGTLLSESLNELRTLHLSTSTIVHKTKTMPIIPKKYIRGHSENPNISISFNRHKVNIPSLPGIKDHSENNSLMLIKESKQSGVREGIYSSIGGVIVGLATKHGIMNVLSPTMDIHKVRKCNSYKNCKNLFCEHTHYGQQYNCVFDDSWNMYRRLIKSDNISKDEMTRYLRQILILLLAATQSLQRNKCAPLLNYTTVDICE